MQQLQKLTLDINLSDTLIGCCKDSSNMIHYINIQNPYTPAITQEVNISDLKNILCNITKLVLSNCSKNIDNKRWDILFTFIKVHLPLLKIIEHEKNEISSLIIEKFNYKINDNIFFKIIDRDDEEPENYQSVLNISSQHDVTRRMNLIYELSISYLYNNIEHLTWKFQDSLMIMANHLILDVGFWTFKNIKMETFIAVTNCLSKYHSNKESLIITNDTGMKEPEDIFSEPNETLMRSILSSWKKLSFLSIDNGFLCPTKACLDNLLSGCNKSLKYMSLNYKFIDVETINYITKNFKNLQYLQISFENIDNIDEMSFNLFFSQMKYISLINCSSSIFCKCLDYFMNNEDLNEKCALNICCKETLTLNDKKYDDICNYFCKVKITNNEKDSQIKEITLSNDKIYTINQLPFQPF